MLDEPFSMLDPQSSRAVRDLIRVQVRELEIPCLLVSHRISDAQELGDRICYLDRGRKTWEGPAGKFPDAIAGCRCGCGPEIPSEQEQSGLYRPPGPGPCGNAGCEAGVALGTKRLLPNKI
jgi:ABC-type multidrug transport system ATPase subunit